MYPFHCILPNGQMVIFQNGLLQNIDERPESYNCLITIMLLSGETQQIMLHELGQHFGFEYSSFLQYLHESSLRNYVHWGLDHDAPLNNQNHIPENIVEENLSIGKIHENIYLKEIGEINGVNVGFGLFASANIHTNVFIGEYVGVVMESSTAISSNYCLNYPTADKSFVINAREIGNIIRFVNHSSTPNTAFQSYIYEGIVHILCVSICEIKENDQITVDYGNSYWLHQEYKPVDLSSS